MKKIAIAVAFCFAAAMSGCAPLNTEPPDIQVMKESRPLGNVKEFNVALKYDLGNLDITKIANEDLFSFDLQYDRRRYEPTFAFNDGDQASMHLEMNGRTGAGVGGSQSDNDLTLRLTDRVPLSLDVTTGVSESHLEMSSMQIRRLRLRGGVGKTDVTFDKVPPEPMQSFDVESGVGELVIHGLGNTRVSSVDLKGGVGRTELDFTGDLGTTTSDATIKVGVGAIRLIIPRDADVEIDGEGSFLSNISAPSFDHHDRTYTHHGAGGSHIRIRVQSGIGGIEVELI